MWFTIPVPNIRSESHGPRPHLHHVASPPSIQFPSSREDQWGRGQRVKWGPFAATWRGISCVWIATGISNISPAKEGMKCPFHQFKGRFHDISGFKLRHQRMKRMNNFTKQADFTNNQQRSRFPSGFSTNTAGDHWVPWFSHLKWLCYPWLYLEMSHFRKENVRTWPIDQCFWMIYLWTMAILHSGRSCSSPTSKPHRHDPWDDHEE